MAWEYIRIIRLCWWNRHTCSSTPSIKRANKDILERIAEESSEVKVLKANLLLGEGKEEEAEAILDSIDDKDDLANIVDVSYMYIDMGFPEKALTWLTRGLEKYAEEEAYLAVTGDCYYAQGLFEKATFFFNKLIDKNPYSAPYWFGLAVATLTSRCSTKQSKHATMPRWPMTSLPMPT